MQLGSIAFLVFLVVVTAGYYALPGVRTRTLWLLAASYAFYVSLSAAWSVVLVGVTLAGYAFGLAIERSGPAAAGGKVPRRTRLVLAGGLVLVIGTLFVFKYAGFAASVFGLGSIAERGLLVLALPVGISFWTFSTISYLVDVARGSQAAERDILRYGLFVAFFPHVSAGPIARAGRLIPQLSGRHSFDFERMRSALLLMLWGFFKKLVVADPLGVIVAAAYGAPHAYAGTPLVLLLATVAFSVQIYCDFSGYTDIVRGSARLLGVELDRNFDRPYEARSIKEFWRRWHMSLMGWFKDYVYIPLGGGRVPRWRRFLNVLVVFLISGLWHGAGWTFVVWGALNGGYQIAGELLAPLRERLSAVLRLRPDGRLRAVLATVSTFALVTATWVFFRAQSLSDALFVLGRIAVPLPGSGLRAAVLGLGLSKAQLLAAVAAALLVFVVEWLSSRHDLLGWLYRRHVVVRWALYQAGVLAVVVLGAWGPAYRAAAFVYERF